MSASRPAALAPLRVSLRKADTGTDNWAPLETGALVLNQPAPHALRVTARDPLGRVVAHGEIHAGGTEAGLTARGAPGWQTISITDAVTGAELAAGRFRVAAETAFGTDLPALDDLFIHLKRALVENPDRQIFTAGGRAHHVEVCWSRDHAFTLKSARYFLRDVTSGTELWLRTQRPDGSFWDCFHPNPSGAPNWFCEALGEGWFAYYEEGRLMARRIPVEADVEYCIAEALWHAWQASGDDAWARRWIPALEAALSHTMTHPLRWSARRGLVKRSFTMDSWDFAHPFFCAGDHRCIHPGDPAFLFHGDNSGLYQFLLQLARLHDLDGNPERAAALRREAEALRGRANALLFNGSHYGHMIPDELPEAEVFARTGDERARLSLSTGYTINRGLPEHRMAVAILDEYQRRRREKAGESWAEWWTMDPPYTPGQWPENGPPPGDYMNGGICLIAAGELAKAAFEHGREACGADILHRAAELPRKRGGVFAEVYRRLPENAAAPRPNAVFLDLRRAANRGLRHGAYPGVPAWTDEGENDMRNLPTGRQEFAGVPFRVIDPAANAGKAVVLLDRADPPLRLDVPPAAAHARSVAFLHTTARAMPDATPVAVYRLCYANGSAHPVFVRAGHEVGHWWGARPEMIAPPPRYDAPPVAALGWQGPNPVWKTTGVFVFTAANPFPERELVAVEIDPSPLLAREAGGLMLCAVSALDTPAEIGLRTLSGGLPLCWAISSVFHALMNGLVGIEDESRAFREVRVAPRFCATPVRRARVCLHYPASDACCALRFERDAEDRVITLDLGGSFERASVHLLLPQGRKAVSVVTGGAALRFEQAEVEQSVYADFTLNGPPGGPVVITLAPG